MKKGYIYVKCEDCDGEGHLEPECYDCGPEECQPGNCEGCYEKCEKCKGLGKIKVPRLKANLLYGKKDTIY